LKLTAKWVLNIPCRSCWAIREHHMPDGACLFGSASYVPDFELDEYFQHQKDAIYNMLAVPAELLKGGK